jgi:Transglycosylase-like domain
VGELRFLPARAGALPSARHVVSPKAPPARVPLDAAVAARARVQAEQVMRDFQAAQEAQTRAAILAAVAEYYRPKTGVNWDGIARCETGGNWSMRGASYSGGLGFYNGTWTSFGGRQFASNAGSASREQQIVVAERVYARYGLSGWGCRAYG